MVLRVTKPELPRPFRVKWVWFVGIGGTLFCGLMLASLFMTGGTWYRIVGWTRHRRSSSTSATATAQRAATLTLRGRMNRCDRESASRSRLEADRLRACSCSPAAGSCSCGSKPGSRDAATVLVHERAGSVLLLSISSSARTTRWRPVEPVPAVRRALQPVSRLQRQRPRRALLVQLLAQLDRLATRLRTRMLSISTATENAIAK